MLVTQDYWSNIMKIIFMGTPNFAVPSLKQLYHSKHEVIAVYTQPPRARGRRGNELVNSPIHQAADELNIPVFTPTNFKNDETIQEFKALNADIAIVVAYGNLLPKAILDSPKLGCFNAHASLLPRWRGAAPIQRAIMAGDTATGIMIMKMDEGLDTGNVALTEKVEITDTMNAGELHDILSSLSADMLVELLETIENKKINLIPQNSIGILYAEKISKSETKLNFAETAQQVYNRFKALTPHPSCWFNMKINGVSERIKLIDCSLTPQTDSIVVKCLDANLYISKIQKPGGIPMLVSDFKRGVKTFEIEYE